MRKPGSISDYIDERNREMVDAYRRAYAGCDICKYRQIMQEVVKMPCSRFWISEERATLMVSRIKRGAVKLESLAPHRRRMYAEIIRRVEAILDSCSGGIPLLHAVSQVVYQPAPEFYMSSDYAYNVVLKSRLSNK